MLRQPRDSRRRWNLRTTTTAIAAIALASWAAPVTADLVFQFDPNDTRTTFQNGFEDNRHGTVPALQIGDQVGWMMDARVPSVPTPDPDNGQDGFIDGQQGNFDNKALLGYHPVGAVLNFLDTANNDNLLIFRDNVGLTNGFGTMADGNVGTIILAGRADPAGTGNSYLLDFRDDAPVGGGTDALDGLGLRYNHNTQMLEGIAKQSVAGTVPVPAGAWFVATYAWDGANNSATLSVQTATGTISDTAVASNVALNSDRARIGNTANGTDGLLGQLGDLLFYNDVADHSTVASQLATDYLSIAELLVNRNTGNISLTVPGTGGAITNVVGYSITSAKNALNPAQWLSIADNYDAGNPGANQVDPDNQWTEMSDPSGTNELAEFEFQGNGGANAGTDFLLDKTTNLGNVWTKYYREDVKVDLALSSGLVIQIPVRFTGNGGEAFALGDLDFDGDVDEADFYDVFVPNYGTDTSGLSVGPARYQLGDIDENGTISLVDFLLLNEAYLEANPGAASLAFTGQSVPEPATWTLLAVGLMIVAGRRVGRGVRNTGWALVVLLAFLPQLSFAAVGGVLDVDFEYLTPGTPINDQARIQDLSGNRYHGVWSGGAAANNTPVLRAFPGSSVVVDNENNQGYVVLQDDLADGGPGSPNPWWGMGNTPTPYFTLGASTSYTFEAVLNWNGDDRANDGIMGQTGTTEWWIRENNGFLEYVFDDGPNRLQNTGTINIGSLIDNDDWHHLGITFARDAGTPTSVVITSFIDYQQVFQETVAVPLGAIGSGTADIRLGAYNTTAANRFDGQMDQFRISDEVLAVNQFLPIPIPPEYVVEVNKTNGMVKIINTTGVDLDIDAYRLTSTNGSLSAASWTSLESQDYEGQGPNSGWTELGDSANELSEGFLGGSSIIGSPTTISLGQIYTNLGNEDPTLKFEYHLPGTSATSFNEIEINYVTGAAVPGDYNGNGIVDAADYAVWRDNLGSSNPAADGNGSGTVDSADYTYWKQRFGNNGSGSGSGSGADASAVPEPTSLVLVSCVAVVCLASRRRTMAWAISFVACLLLAATTAKADAFADRQYTLGDDPFEGAVAGSPVGSFTYDSMGVNLTAFPGAINSGAYQDLVAAGTPQYADIGATGLKRPGAGTGGSGTVGITFDGVDDRLTTTVSLNWPNATWRTAAFFPTGTDSLYDPPSATGSDGTGDGEYRPAFPHNYAGIHRRAVQAWVRPDVAGLDGARQDVLLDTNQHGIYITASNTWALQFANATFDTLISVADTLDANGWVHVMALGGISPSQGNNTPIGGALLINGVAVVSSTAIYAAQTTALSIGSNLAGNGNFFQGTIDDVEMLIAGDNSFKAPFAGNQQLGYLGGADWGRLRADDNQWIALQLAALAQAASVPSIPDADVNFDGVVAGNGTGSVATDDVSAFVSYYGNRNLVGMLAIGDWNSRQEGDLNFDGLTNISDAIMLRDALLAAGSGSFDFGLLAGAAVPEPSASALALLAGFVCWGWKRWWKS